MIYESRAPSADYVVHQVIGGILLIGGILCSRRKSGTSRHANGWLLCQEQIDVFTAGGALLILAGNLLNLHRKSAKPAEVAAS